MVPCPSCGQVAFRAGRCTSCGFAAPRPAPPPGYAPAASEPEPLPSDALLEALSLEESPGGAEALPSDALIEALPAEAALPSDALIEALPLEGLLEAEALPSAPPDDGPAVERDPADPPSRERRRPAPAASPGPSVFAYSTCPECQTPQPDPVPTFCESCGFRLKRKIRGGQGEEPKKCRECGVRNASDRVSCLNCGTKLS